MENCQKNQIKLKKLLTKKILKYEKKTVDEKNLKILWGRILENNLRKST